MERLSSGMGGEIKKGLWTTEEDLILSSYIEENGPGNWTSVPTHAGLNRCGKSCRLRWNNYLRPGIKQGNFTAEEDRKIVKLQALLGNKWAGIAHYIPGRTDNDVKNRWHSNLKKKVDGAHGNCNDVDQHLAGVGSSATGVPAQDSSKGCWERKLHADVHLATKALSDALCPFPQASDPDHNAMFLSPPASVSNFDVTQPLTTPGVGSSLPMATEPLLSLGCMSFKPPRGWNQEVSHQQLMIPAADHQLRSQAASQINHASHYSNTKPYIFICENIGLWLQRWCKETPKSRLDNEKSALLKRKYNYDGSGATRQLGNLSSFYERRYKSAAVRYHNRSKENNSLQINDKGIMDSTKNIVRSSTSFENSMHHVNSKENDSAYYQPLPPAAVAPPAFLGGEQESDPPPVVVATTASPSGQYGGQNEDDNLLQLSMSVPDQATWPFF